jgi:hypothetical protein
MLKTRRLLRREITYSAAEEEEVNILHQLGYYDQRAQFFDNLDAKRNWIKAAVAHHLSLTSPAACHVAETEDWLHGSFNVCVPVTVDNGKRVLVRFPPPYRVGEAFRPGNGDEKIRCEAGTYAWLQENCPMVPIPRLYGLPYLQVNVYANKQIPLAFSWLIRSFSSPDLNTCHFSPDGFNACVVGFYRV